MVLPGSSPGAVAALDFFSNEARAVLAARVADGTWRVLGVGTAPLEGIAAGHVTHVSDAAETVAAAIRAVSRTAGCSVASVFYTLHDTHAVFTRFRASRMLAGEGQVRPGDVRAVFSAAERLAGSFEMANVYSSVLGFVIDDQDPITEPVGVFGRKLGMEAGFLQVRSQTLAVWRDVMQRAYAPSPCAVPLAQAAILGSLGLEPDRQKRIFYFERDGEVILCQISGGRIETFSLCSGIAPAELLSGEAHEILTAGDSAEKTAERLARETGMAVRAARPEAVVGLHAPTDAPTAGLLLVARERERSKLTSRHGHGLARKVRRQMTTLWNDYF